MLMGHVHERDVLIPTGMAATGLCARRDPSIVRYAALGKSRDFFVAAAECDQRQCIVLE